MTITLSLGWIFIILAVLGFVASWIHSKLDPSTGYLAGIDGFFYCILDLAWWLFLAIVYIIILHSRG